MSQHGTHSGYANGCRCGWCREASTVYQRERRRRRKEALANGTVNPTHGTWSTYTNYGCRCDACRAAAGIKNHESWLKRSAKGTS